MNPVFNSKKKTTWPSAKHHPLFPCTCAVECTTNPLGPNVLNTDNVNRTSVFGPPKRRLNVLGRSGRVLYPSDGPSCPSSPCCPLQGFGLGGTDAPCLSSFPSSLILTFPAPPRRAVLSLGLHLRQGSGDSPPSAPSPASEALRCHTAASSASQPLRIHCISPAAKTETFNVPTPGCSTKRFPRFLDWSGSGSGTCGHIGGMSTAAYISPQWCAVSPLCGASYRD